MIALHFDMAVGQNHVPLVNIKIACEWMLIDVHFPENGIEIGIDPERFRLRRQDLGNICSGISVINDH